MRDPNYEQFLNRGAFKWSYYEAIPLAEIDLEASATNPARLLYKLDQDRVESYAIHMLDGIEFPAVALTHSITDNDGKYIVMDGMHRLRGAQTAERKTVAAYVINEDDEYRRELLARMGNTINGFGVSMHDQILQAVEIHRKYPHVSLNQLAKEWGLRQETLSKAWREEKVNDRAEELGIIGFGDLKQSVKLALQAINNVPLFTAATNLILSYDIKHAEALELAKEIRKAPDEASGRQMIERTRDAIEEQRAREKAKRGHTKTTKGVLLIGRCKTISKSAEHGTAPLHLAALPDPAGSLSVVEQAIDYLQSVARELTALVKRRNNRQLGSNIQPPRQAGLN